MKRVSIDGNRCQGHGRCQLVNDKIFDFDEYGHGKVNVSEVTTDSDIADVEEAAMACPESAVIVTD